VFPRTGRKHDIGTQFLDELFVARRGVGDHAQTVCPGQLDGIAAHRASRSGDRDGPGVRSSTSSTRRTVKPFIGRDAASASVAPAGTLTTDSAGTTMRSDPQVGVHALTDLFQHPGASMPGTNGGGTSMTRSGRAPLRRSVSVGLTAAVWT
jgi:hypothetical protein